MSQEEEKEGMSFLQHLEALRWHIIRSLIAILVFTIAAFIYKDFVFGEIILAPTRPDFWTFRKLCELGTYASESLPINADAICVQDLDFQMQNRKLSGQFTMHLMSSFVFGFLAAFPYTFWEIWRFVSPGLKKRERKGSRGAVFVVSVLFMAGVAFGYYLVTPLAVNFFYNYQIVESIRNDIDISSYIGTFTGILLASGFLFQLPVIIYFLSRAGLVTPSFLRSRRKHAFVIILVVAAVFTPPDVVTQILLAIPLLFLYEISIRVSTRVTKKRLKDIGYNEDEISKLEKGETFVDDEEDVEV